MYNHKRKFKFVFILLFSITISLHSYQGEALKPSQNVSLVRENAQRLENISYLHSTGHAISLHNGKDLVIDWGFGGSGSLLESFSPVKVSLKASVGAGNDDEKGFSAIDFAKVIAISRLKKGLQGSWGVLQQYIPDLNWLLDEQYTPLKVFALKLFILMKDQTLKDQAFRKKAEILRLLFKLSQSGVLDSIDKSKKLSEYLPDNLKTFIDKDSDWVKFIDDAWSKIVNNFSDYDFQLQELNSGKNKKFTFSETFKFIFIALLNSFNEYKAIKLKELEDGGSNFDMSKRLSEDDKRLIQELRSQEERLVDAFNAVKYKVDRLEADLEKSKPSGHKQTEYDKDIFSLLNKEFQEAKAERDLYEKELLEIQSKINELEYGIDISSGKEINVAGSGLFNLLLSVLLKTPEFQEMAFDINGKNPAYHQIRDTLYMNLAKIFKNSEHMKDNLSVYRYIIRTLFPRLKGFFHDVSEGLRSSENLGAQEALMAALGLL